MRGNNHEEVTYVIEKEMYKFISQLFPPHLSSHINYLPGKERN